MESYKQLSDDELKNILEESRMLEGAYAEAIIDDPDCARSLNGPLSNESDKVTSVLNELYNRGVSISL